MLDVAICQLTPLPKLMTLYSGMFIIGFKQGRREGGGKTDIPSTR